MATSLAHAHHVLFRVSRDFRAVRPHPESLPDEGLEVRHLVDVRLRHVGVALHHFRHLREDLFIQTMNIGKSTFNKHFVRPFPGLRGSSPASTG